jgi:hypothetical protein
MRCLVCILLLAVSSVRGFSQTALGFIYAHETVFDDIEDEDGRNEYTIQFVFRKSPAEKVGLKVGDRIIKFDDAILDFVNPLAMQNIIKASPATVRMIISRNKLRDTLLITKAERSTFSNLCLSGNCVNGVGSFVYGDGLTYTGPFRNGKRDGVGKAFTASGDVYDGDWKNDMRQGKGTLTVKHDPRLAFVTGWTYKGDWANDAMNGKGEIKYVTGAYYVGEMAANARNGTGRQLASDGSVVEGLWKDNKMNGRGVMTKKNGDTFTGNFVDGNLEGEVVVYIKATNTKSTVKYWHGVAR